MKMGVVKYSYLFVLFSFCLVENVYSQADAGRDKTICEGDNGVIIGGQGDPSWCYTWSPSIGINSNDVHNLHPTVKPPSNQIYKLTVVGPNFSFTSTDEVKVVVIDTSITPIYMEVTESLNSGSFSVSTPTDVSSTTYRWTWSCFPNSGNSPNVIFSNQSSNSTAVNSTRWYAYPNRNRAAETSMKAPYRMTCEIRANNTTCIASKGFLLVTVARTQGQITRPDFVGGISIAQQSNGMWAVSGIGSFQRRAAVLQMLLPTTSQFYRKCLKHEEKHIHQWTLEAPWKDLFDANKLYNNVIVNLTDNTQAGLTIKINQAISNQRQIDEQISINTQCQREIEAWRVSRSYAPNYIELEDADVPGEYNCIP